MPRHEVSDVNSKGLMWFAISLLIGAVVMHLSLKAIFFKVRDHSAENSHPKTVEASLVKMREAPPEPQLQTDPVGDLQIYLSRENKLLSTYGWVDKKAGIARIPIERAMDLKSTSRGSNE